MLIHFLTDKSRLITKVFVTVGPLRGLAKILGQRAHLQRKYLLRFSPFFYTATFHIQLWVLILK